LSIQLEARDATGLRGVNPLNCHTRGLGKGDKGTKKNVRNTPPVSKPTVDTTKGRTWKEKAGRQPRGLGTGKHHTKG